MDIKQKTLAHSRHSVEVSITSKEIDSYFEKARELLASHIKIPGFRAGKAPVELASKQIDGERLREEALRQVVSAAWRGALERITVAPIEDPEVDVVSFEREKTGELVFKFDIKPEVKIGKWQSIKPESSKKVEKETISEEELSAAIRELSNGYAKLVVKTEPAKKGDEISIEMRGTLGGKPVARLTADKHSVSLGAGGMIPGFEEKLYGAKRGDEREFSLIFPTNHFEKELSGKKVEFQVKILEVFSVELPTEEELAGQMGHKDVSALREGVRKHYEEMLRDQLKSKRQASWLEQFSKMVTIDLPESLINREVARSKEQLTKFLSSRKLTLAQWFEQNKTTEQKQEEDRRKAAESSLKIGLGIAEIAKQQGKELKSHDDFRKLLDELSAGDGG